MRERKRRVSEARGERGSETQRGHLEVKYREYSVKKKRQNIGFEDYSAE